MERDWARLGAALKAGREALGLTQAELGDRIGVGRDAVRLIEDGGSKRLTATIREYGRTVGWTPESAQDVLAGGDPVLASSAAGPSAGAPDDSSAGDVPYAEGMPDRIRFELSDGRVLDTDVIDLSVPGSESKLVLVAMAGASDAPDEQKRSEVLRWARIQRRVRQIVDEELSNP